MVMFPQAHQGTSLLSGTQVLKFMVVRCISHKHVDMCVFHVIYPGVPCLCLRLYVAYLHFYTLPYFVNFQKGKYKYLNSSSSAAALYIASCFVLENPVFYYYDLITVPFV